MECETTEKNTLYPSWVGNARTIPPIWGLFSFMEEKLLFDFGEIPVETKTQVQVDADEYQSIVLKSEVKKDEYTNYIQDTFDLKVGDVSKVCIPNKLNIESLKDWNIGVICGASGSGKSTILKHLAKQHNAQIASPLFDSSKCLISNFDTMTPKDATMLLSQMGLASVPTWIRPFNVLSNGEQYRASLAKAVCDAKDGEIIFVDEYTSVVDRNVAMSMSNALQKYIRRTNKKIILATCHYDIFEWLRPDWIYDLNKGGALEKGDYLRRPQIELQVYRTTTDTWERFKKYHYMTAELSESATCFVFTWNDKIVAFESILPLPSGGFDNGYREHRLVVLPDYQGLGIGIMVSQWMGGVCAANGKQLFTKTVNPALGIYREKNKDKWTPTSHNLKGMTDRESSRMMGGLTRLSYCHKYVGQPIKGFEELLLPIDKVRYNNSMKGQLTFNFE